MKVFLISHIADPDGIMPVILTDLAFLEYDYHLIEANDADKYMEEAIANNTFDEFDKVIMTDVCISEEMAMKIDKMPLKDKLIILDHHYGNEALNKYDFINVVDEKDGIKESATSLYYKYLLANFSNSDLLKNSIAYMVSLVRLGDTWEWKKYDIVEARDLGTIFSFYGKERFINHYISFLRKNREFYFNEAEKVLIETDNKRKLDYIEDQKDKIIKKEIEGYRVGIVFAELYRSELGNALAEYYKDEIDLIMIININRSLSFRGIKEDINVNEFASFFGGSGHKLAAGAPLPLNIKDKIIEYILETIKK